MRLASYFQRMELLSEGLVISARSISDDDVVFGVTVTSSTPLARGSSADIYRGEVPEHLARGGLVALKVFTKTINPNLPRDQVRLPAPTHAA